MIDLRERLAVYEDPEIRPGWRDDLIAADALRAGRPLRTDPRLLRDHR